MQFSRIEEPVDLTVAHAGFFSDEYEAAISRESPSPQS
jgi:hypothetical protein